MLLLSPKKDNYLVTLPGNVILNTSLIKNFSPKKDNYLVTLLGNVISNTSLNIKLEPYFYFVSMGIQS